MAKLGAPPSGTANSESTVGADAAQKPRTKAKTKSTAPQPVAPSALAAEKTRAAKEVQFNATVDAKFASLEAALKVEGGDKASVHTSGV